MLTEANRSLNLTRVPPDEFVTLHFLDSLSLAAALSPRPGDRLIDVGTGAGFPGVPLALAYPELSVTLLDGTRKRLDFIDSAIAELAISNARTLHGRAEDISRQSTHRCGYDIATARAVAKLPHLAGWMLPLVRPSGHAVAYKSQDVDAETEDARPAIARLGGTVERVVEVALPESQIVRKLIILDKLPSAMAVRSAVRKRSVS